MIKTLDGKQVERVTVDSAGKRGGLRAPKARPLCTHLTTIPAVFHATGRKKLHFKSNSFEQHIVSLRSCGFTRCWPHILISSFFSRLNGKHVVFGSVVDGIDVVKAIEKQGTKSGSPKAKVAIADCGELK